VLLEEWAQAGCAAAFLDRPMSDDPHDHLLLQIRGAVAEYERTLIAERMRRGRLAKLRAGVLLPWTYAPYGYRMSPDRPRDPHGVTLDPAEAAVVAELFALYREPGMSLMRLAMHLDARGVPTPSGTPRWSSATIRGILRNPIDTGQIYAQRTQYRAPTHRRSATHPIGRPHGTPVPQPADAWLLVGQVSAVVSQAHFDEVQAKLATNRSFARRNNTAHQYLLRALVSCGCCGLACTARAINGRNFYYLCNGKGHSTYSHRATCCPARHTPAGQLDELVWKDLCTLLAEPGPLAAAVARAHGGAWLPQELQARRETLRRAQAHLAQQLERLTDAYLRAVLPLDEYERRRRDLEQRMRALAGQEELLRHDVARRQQLAGVAASLEAFRARVQHGLAAATFEQRRQLVLLLIDRVIVTDAEVEIRYVLPTSPESEHVQFCHLRKDYFHHPSARQQHEAAPSGRGAARPSGGSLRDGLGWADDLQGDAVRLGRLGRALAGAALIDKGQLHVPAGASWTASASAATAARSLALAGVTRRASRRPSVSPARCSLEPRALVPVPPGAVPALGRGARGAAVQHRRRRLFRPPGREAQHGAPPDAARRADRAPASRSSPPAARAGPAGRPRPIVSRRRAIRLRSSAGSRPARGGRLFGMARQGMPFLTR
jgi:site-specific DNA recombinase